MTSKIAPQETEVRAIKPDFPCDSVFTDSPDVCNRFRLTGDASLCLANGSCPVSEGENG